MVHFSGLPEITQEFNALRRVECQNLFLPGYTGISLTLDKMK
ncbi:hypothetical protein HMPREF9374_2328 [Desmospora sp. 8437]|nr:hypothetical protein HMPREF9374_2328 [Desmospora sp. 8437]